MKNYYKVLDIPENASEEEIRKAYHKLAKQWHPDRNPSVPLSHEMIKMYNEAYAVLSDPQKKRAHEISIGFSPPETDNRATSGPDASAHVPSGGDMTFPVDELLLRLKARTSARLDRYKPGFFISRLSAPAYGWELLLGVLLAVAFVYLSFTFQGAFFTPLFLILVGFIVSCILYSLIKLAILVSKTFEDDKGRKER